jgi:hypothetical protein
VVLVVLPLLSAHLVADSSADVSPIGIISDAEATASGWLALTVAANTQASLVGSCSGGSNGPVV